MDSLDFALTKLYKVEFDNLPQRFLHKNKTEDYLTIAGIAEKWHKHSIDWEFIKSILKVCNNSITRASTLLYYDKEINNQIRTIYMNEYFHKMKLDKVASQTITNEMFLFGVNVGCENAIKAAQRVVGVKDDGIIGGVTLQALNSFSPIEFDKLYDEEEMKYYKNLADTKSSMAVYLNGWKNRSAYV